MEAESWNDFGYARLDDHAGERFGRSGRWVRDLASLGRGLDALPGLEDALSGDDGRRPIGIVAATWIARQASKESVTAWIDQARVLTARGLRDELRVAREADSDFPVNLKQSSGTDSGAPMGDIAQDESRIIATHGSSGERDASETTADWRVVKFRTPQAVKVAFDETLDLYRALEGRDESRASFVEALVAEASSGLQPPVVELDFVVPGRSQRVMEYTLARITGNWSHLDGLEEDIKACPMTGAQRRAGTGVPGASESNLQSGLEVEAAMVAGVVMEATAGTGVAGGPGSPFPLPAPEGTDPDSRIRWLLQVAEQLERRLGELLAWMDDAGAWRRLQFAGLGHYAEQRLGLARSTAHERARLAKALRSLDVVHRAYEAGRIGLAATLCVVRILGDEPANNALQQEWVERAEKATVKRLRDEAKALRRREVADRLLSRRDQESAEAFPLGTGEGQAGRSPSNIGDGPAERSPSICDSESNGGLAPGSDAELAGCSPSGNGIDSAEPGSSSNGDEAAGCSPSVSGDSGVAGPGGLIQAPRAATRCRQPRPLSDAEWHASLRREVGTAREGVRKLGRAALGEPGSGNMLRMVLPMDLAQAFLGTVEAARRRLAERVQGLEEREEDTDAPSVMAARMFSTRGLPVPAWVGLLAILEEFVETWDVRHGGRRPSENAVHIRDGWRCMAPGCTSRRNLQEHHVRYRSQGGSHEMANRVCLCEFHHLRGEHGELASCRGEAPLGLEWSLGCGGKGGQFRNETRPRGPSSIEWPRVSTASARISLAGAGMFMNETKSTVSR